MKDGNDCLQGGWIFSLTFGFGLFYVANLALMAMTAVFICPIEVYGMPGVWIERWKRNLTLWFLAGNEGRLELLQN